MSSARNQCFVMGCPEQVQYTLMDGHVCKAAWSAGHLVVYIAMDQMVGDRQSPGARILGGEAVYLFCQPSLYSPANSLRTS